MVQTLMQLTMTSGIASTMAVGQGSEIVELLFQKGANKSHILNGTDNHGCTPLQVADIYTVELLLQLLTSVKYFPKDRVQLQACLSTSF